MSLQSEPLVVEQREHVIIATLNRPERRNALSRDLLLALGRLGKELKQRRDVRALILTGAGDRAFCAGADLKERRGMSIDQVRDALRLYPSCLGFLDELDFPSVAALNGSALGGGLELALACDLRVSVPSAVFGLPETSLGIIPAAGGVHGLYRILGEARAKEMILLGDTVDAEKAYEVGLVHRLAERDDVVADALDYIEPIAKGAPIAQRAALLALRSARKQSLREGMAIEQELYETCLKSRDRVEALTAFSEKRPPRFEGR